jgi:hypothetical protein
MRIFENLKGRARKSENRPAVHQKRFFKGALYILFCG